MTHVLIEKCFLLCSSRVFLKNLTKHICAHRRELSSWANYPVGDLSQIHCSSLIFRRDFSIGSEHRGDIWEHKTNRPVNFSCYYLFTFVFFLKYIVSFHILSTQSTWFQEPPETCFWNSIRYPSSNCSRWFRTKPAENIVNMILRQWEGAA